MYSVPAFTSLSGRDRGFAHALVAATLRHLGFIDFVLEEFVERMPPPSGLALLRLGAGQLFGLGTPAHAAVSETVALARASRDTYAFTGLANAVLRRLASISVDEAMDEAGMRLIPEWVAARWRATYGGEAALDLARAGLVEPPLDLTLKPGADRTALIAEGAIGLHTGSLRFIDPTRDIAALPGFEDGDWWVQDAAAAAPAKLLGAQPGMKVIDLGAAPGGKTMQLCAAGADVIAVERSNKRAERLRRNLERTKLEATIVAADALEWKPDAEADAILLDAPCTATGTWRRHPEALWIKDLRDVQALARTQAQMLAAARDMLKPGGVLVYAVCSLEPEEGPAVVNDAIATGGWTRSPVTAAEPGILQAWIDPAGDLRTLPTSIEDGGCDGFYAARLIKT
jgi:16S rRNA (cytosine967-C5)-methyltransferase